MSSKRPLDDGASNQSPFAYPFSEVDHPNPRRQRMSSDVQRPSGPGPRPLGGDDYQYRHSSTQALTGAPAQQQSRQMEGRPWHQTTSLARPPPMDPRHSGYAQRPQAFLENNQQRQSEHTGQPPQQVSFNLGLFPQTNVIGQYQPSQMAQAIPRQPHQTQSPIRRAHVQQTFYQGSPYEQQHHSSPSRQYPASLRPQSALPQHHISPSSTEYSRNVPASTIGIAHSSNHSPSNMVTSHHQVPSHGYHPDYIPPSTVFAGLQAVDYDLPPGSIVRNTLIQNNYNTGFVNHRGSIPQNMQAMQRPQGDLQAIRQAPMPTVNPALVSAPNVPTKRDEERPHPKSAHKYPSPENDTATPTRSPHPVPRRRRRPTSGPTGQAPVARMDPFIMEDPSHPPPEVYLTEPLLGVRSQRVKSCDACRVKKVIDTSSRGPALSIRVILYPTNLSQDQMQRAFTSSG